jgi:hypothetical protein
MRLWQRWFAAKKDVKKLQITVETGILLVWGGDLIIIWFGFPRQEDFFTIHFYFVYYKGITYIILLH